MTVFCPKCGAQNYESAVTCASCQAVLPVIASQTHQAQADYQQPYQPSYEPIQPPAPMYGQPMVQDWRTAGADKKVVAGVLGLLIGSLGIHKFVLGYQTEGIIMLLVSVLSCGTLAPIMSIIGIVEGIMYLTKTDEAFVREYIYGRKGWF
jgi:TM2 domain-containing membrane protein YozV